MEPTSYAIGAILLLQCLGIAATLILNRMTSIRIESRIEALKIELAEWLLEQAGELEISSEVATPWQMAMPFIQERIESYLHPTIEAKSVTPRGKDGQFAATISE